MEPSNIPNAAQPQQGLPSSQPQPNVPAPVTLSAPAPSAVYASFGQRLGAVLIDMIVLLVLNGVISMLGLPFLALPVIWLYGAIFYSSAKQGTPGQQLVGIKVTDISGSRIKFGRALLRAAMRTVSALILLVGYFMMLMNEKHQTLHDMVAGTVVVSAKNTTQQPPAPTAQPVA